MLSKWRPSSNWLTKHVFVERIYNRSRNFYHRLRQAVFRPYCVTRRVGDVNFQFLVGDYVGARWYDSLNHSDWPELRWLQHRIIEPGDIVFECGSHHGYFTAFIAKLVGDSGLVVAFEPIAENVRVLRDNVRLNNLNQVRVFQRAVGRTTGAVVSMAEMSVGEKKDDGRLWTVAETVALDDFAEYSNLWPNVLKIDVEGYEVEVLLGARKVLARRPKLAIEIHCEFLSRYGRSLDDLLQLLPLNDYACWVQTEETPSPIPFNPRAVNLMDYYRMQFYGVPRDHRPVVGLGKEQPM